MMVKSEFDSPENITTLFSFFVELWCYMMVKSESLIHQTISLLSFLFCRIMVLDEGEIREFDTPDRLLQNTEGLFYQLAQDAGIV